MYFTGLRPYVPFTRTEYPGRNDRPGALWAELATDAPQQMLPPSLLQPNWRNTHS